MFTYGSLFSGIGGMDLGFDRAGLTCKWQVELAPYARGVLDRHWPNVPKFEDVRHFPPPESLDTHEVDLICGGFPCFPPGTMIETSIGPRPIETLKIGDEVVTHKNRLRKVLGTMRKPASTESPIPALKIRVFGALPFVVTDEHPFYIRRRTYVRKGKYRNLSPKLSEPEWVQAKDLDVDCFLCQPTYVPTVEREWESTSFWYLIGRWLGDGWIVNHKRKSNIQGKRGSRVNSRVWKAIICGGADEKQEILDAVDGAGFHGCPAVDRTGVKVHICSKRLVEFLSSFGRGAENKHIPEWVFGAPQDVLAAILKGLCDSDGHYNKSGTIEFGSISNQLALNVSRLMRMVLKKPVAFYPGNKAGTVFIDVTIKDSYSVRVSSKRTIGVYEDGMAWVPLRSITRLLQTQDVYNVEVEEDNSYVACSYAVHNCKQISNARTAQVATPEGLEGKDSGLWYEYSRIIRDLRPRWVVIENVGALNVRGLSTVLWELAGQGYCCEWATLSAAALGAPHLRKRLFIVAVQNSHIKGLEGHVGKILAQPDDWRQDAYAARSNWGDTTPRLCGGSNGVPGRLVHARGRLTALGNAVVPAVGEFIGKRIAAVEAAIIMNEIRRGAIPPFRAHEVTHGKH